MVKDLSPGGKSTKFTYKINFRDRMPEKEKIETKGATSDHVYAATYDFDKTELAAEVSPLSLKIAEIDRSGNCIVQSNSTLVVQH